MTNRKTPWQPLDTTSAPIERPASDLAFDPNEASLRRIQCHSVSIDNGAPVSGISSINQDQAATMAALKVKKLSNELQLSLL